MKAYLELMDRMNQSFEQLKALMLQNVEESRQLERFGLTPQQEVIMFYIIRHTPVIAKQIGEQFGISKSAVSQVLARLESQGMITRRKNPSNKTESFIELGSEGRAYAELLAQLDERLVQKYYSKVSLEELEAVLSVLNKLLLAAKKEAGNYED